MSGAGQHRGGAPVGRIADLDGLAAASVIYLRLWCDGPDAQSSVRSDLESGLGHARGGRALKAFMDLCSLCATHARRPLMTHAATCKCLGSDEACFANFIATAAMGEREDAMLIATLLVRVDVAPLVTALATDFGHALMRMNLSAPKDIAAAPAFTASYPPTVH